MLPCIQIRTILPAGWFLTLCRGAWYISLEVAAWGCEGIASQMSKFQWQIWRAQMVRLLMENQLQLEKRRFCQLEVKLFLVGSSAEAKNAYLYYDCPWMVSWWLRSTFSVCPWLLWKYCHMNHLWTWQVLLQAICTLRGFVSITKKTLHQRNECQVCFKLSSGTENVMNLKNRAICPIPARSECLKDVALTMWAPGSILVAVATFHCLFTWHQYCWTTQLPGFGMKKIDYPLFHRPCSFIGQAAWIC